MLSGHLDVSDEKQLPASCLFGVRGANLIDSCQKSPSDKSGTRFSRSYHSIRSIDSIENYPTMSPHWCKPENPLAHKTPRRTYKPLAVFVGLCACAKVINRVVLAERRRKDEELPEDSMESRFYLALFCAHGTCSLLRPPLTHRCESVTLLPFGQSPATS